MAESTIVSAVGVATVSRNGGKVLAKRIADAMSAAVLACNAAGVSTDEKNSPVIRAAMMAARARVLAEFKKVPDGPADV